MRVGGNQFHFSNVAPDGFALCLDAAAVQLHSQASQSHACLEANKQSESAAACIEKSSALREEIEVIFNYRIAKNSPSLMAAKARRTAAMTTKTLAFIIAPLINSATTETKKVKFALEEADY